MGGAETVLIFYLPGAQKGLPNWNTKRIALEIQNSHHLKRVCCTSDIIFTLVTIYKIKIYLHGIYLSLTFSLNYCFFINHMCKFRREMLICNDLETINSLRPTLVRIYIVSYFKQGGAWSTFNNQSRQLFSEIELSQEVPKLIF